MWGSKYALLCPYMWCNISFKAAGTMSFLFCDSGAYLSEQILATAVRDINLIEKWVCGTQSIQWKYRSKEDPWSPFFKFPSLTLLSEICFDLSLLLEEGEKVLK